MKTSASSAEAKTKVKWKRDAEAVVPCDTDKQGRGQELDCGITKRNMFFADRGISAERNVAKNWNVVVKSDHRATRGTTRVRKYDRLLQRHAMNYNVEKTSEDRAENSCDDVSKREIGSSQASGVCSIRPRIHTDDTDQK